MTRPFSTSRMRLIALLVVAAFTISTAVVATAYVASPASAAKKKKKCKKGYKKVKGKCKKKKSATTVKVTDIKLGAPLGSQGRVTVRGMLTTNVVSRSKLNGEITVTVGGVNEKFPVAFTLSGSKTTQFSKSVTTTFADVDGGTVTVTVGGKTSAAATIK